MSEIPNDQQLLLDAESDALALIREYQGVEGRAPQALNSSEKSESLLLANNYDLLFERYSGKAIVFSPRIQGAGFVDACTGDLSVGESLFEVKTVTRNIAGKDIRQLLVYLALQAATGSRRWTGAGFFNPRRASVYEFSVDEALPLMSGGRLATEVFEEMVQYFCSRDIELDLAF